MNSPAECIWSKKTLPLGSNYGQVTLIPPTTLDYLEQFAGLNANLSTEKILFLDTETLQPEHRRRCIRLYDRNGLFFR